MSFGLWDTKWECEGEQEAVSWKCILSYISNIKKLHCNALFLCNILPVGLVSHILWFFFHCAVERYRFKAKSKPLVSSQLFFFFLFFFWRRFITAPLFHFFPLFWNILQPVMTWAIFSVSYLNIALVSVGDKKRLELKLFAFELMVDLGPLESLWMCRRKRREKSVRCERSHINDGDKSIVPHNGSKWRHRLALSASSATRKHFVHAGLFFIYFFFFKPPWDLLCVPVVRFAVWRSGQMQPFYCTLSGIWKKKKKNVRQWRKINTLRRFKALLIH